MERAGAVFKALVTTYAATLLSILLTLVIAPLYVRHLGFEQMGLLAVGQAIAGYLTLTQGGLSTSTMILVSHAKGREDWSEIARVLRHSLVLSAAAVSLVGLLTSLLVMLVERAPALRHTLRLEHPDIPKLIWVVGSQVMVALAFSSFYDLLAGLQENHRASVFQGVNRVAGQVASGVTSVLFGSATAVIAAGVAVSVCTGVAVTVDARRRHAAAFRKVPIESREIVLQVRTGLKSFNIQAGATLSSYAPVAAVNHFAGPAAVPYFTLPNQIISLVAGVIGSLSGLMLPVFGEAWAKGDQAWIQTTVSKLLEKMLLLLAAAVAGFLALGGPFLKAWVQLDVPLLMLVSVTLIACGTNLVSYFKFLLSALNRHRLAGISELLNGVLALLLALLACRFSIHAVGVGIALAGALTSYWLLPLEIRRHVGIARVLPPTRSLLLIAGVAVLVYATARLSFVLLNEVLHLHAIVAVLVAAALGSLAFLKASSLTGMFDWRVLRARFTRSPNRSTAGPAS